jgi:hypothetical protein
MVLGADCQPCQSPLSCCLTLTAVSTRTQVGCWNPSGDGQPGGSTAATGVRSWRDAPQPAATENHRRPDRCWSRPDQGLGVGMAVPATDGPAARGHASGIGALPRSGTSQRVVACNAARHCLTAPRRGSTAPRPGRRAGARLRGSGSGRGRLGQPPPPPRRTGGGAAPGLGANALRSACRLGGLDRMDDEILLHHALTVSHRHGLP